MVGPAGGDRVLSRAQLIAYLAIGMVAAYVVATTLERLEDGRCRAGLTSIDCGAPKERPNRPAAPVVREGETLA